MGWERGYYYRVRKVNGKVIREYVGTGLVANLAAQLDALKQDQRRQEKLHQAQEKARLETLDAGLKNFEEIAKLVARAALLAAGYHQHKRGDWRKKREPDGPTSETDPEADTSGAVLPD